MNKNSYGDELIDKRIKLYELLIESPEDLSKIMKEKKIQSSQTE